MACPLVAVTTYPTDASGDVHLPVEYVDAVRRAGGRAMLVPPGDDDPEALLDDADAVVLAGGGDLDPAIYGGSRHPTVYQTDSERDASEMELAQLVLTRGVPTFAICRGLQVVNVALGGTLHVHLPEVYGDAVAHRLPPREPVPHAVKVDSDALAARSMLATEIEPSSWHHQSVDRLGAGLRVVARAPDGVIEAVEHDTHPFLLAVQWHPELTAAADATQQRLFDALVVAAHRRSDET